jgi:hypothetical protein
MSVPIDDLPRKLRDLQPTPTSSPTAAGPTACTPTRPCEH